MMKYIIDEEELRDLLRNYFMIDAINLGKTNKDDILDDFEDYLNNNGIPPESYRDFENGFNVLVNEEIDVNWKNEVII